MTVGVGEAAVGIDLPGITSFPRKGSSFGF